MVESFVSSKDISGNTSPAWSHTTTSPAFRLPTRPPYTPGRGDPYSSPTRTEAIAGSVTCPISLNKLLAKNGVKIHP